MSNEPKYMPGMQTPGEEFDDTFSLLRVAGEGVRIQTLGKKMIESVAHGVILPSFGWNLHPNDEAFKDTVHSMFREQIPNKEEYYMAPWAFRYISYPFIKYGSGESPNIQSFLAPLTWKDSDPDRSKHDPFQDIRQVVRDSTMDESQKDAYLKGKWSPTNPVDAIIPQRRVSWAFNALVGNRQEPAMKHTVLSMTETAYLDVGHQAQKTLSRGLKDEPLDPAFNSFVLGDVTRPEAALVWTCSKRGYLGAKDGQMANVLDFSRLPGRAYNDTGESMVTKHTITTEELRARVNLWDPANWHQASYQEMVDFIVEHLVNIPMEFVKEACSGKATVGTRKAAATHIGPGQGSVMPQQQGPVQAGPDIGAPSAPAPTPGAPPVDTSKNYWVSVNGAASQPMSAADASAMPSGAGVQLLDQADPDQSNWVSWDSVFRPEPAPTPTPGPAPTPPANPTPNPQAPVQEAPAPQQPQPAANPAPATQQAASTPEAPVTPVSQPTGMPTPQTAEGVPDAGGSAAPNLPPVDISEMFGEGVSRFTDEQRRNAERLATSMNNGETPSGDDVQLFTELQAAANS